MSDTGQTTQASHSAGARTSAAQVGRRIGIATFWCLAAYVVGMSALSIIPSLYFPAAAKRPPEAGTDRCALELGELERDLIEGAGRHLETPERTPLGPWLARWDRRFMALSGGCGTLESARGELGSLRGGIESMLRRYDADHAPAQERIHEALSAHSLTDTSTKH